VGPGGNGGGRGPGAISNSDVLVDTYLADSSGRLRAPSHAYRHSGAQNLHIQINGTAEKRRHNLKDRAGYLKEVDEHQAHA
jgi:hypothetical protein